MSRLPVGGSPYVFFDARETTLLEQTCAWLEKHDPAEALRVEAAFKRLAGLAVLVADSPSIGELQPVRSTGKRDGESLLEQLCRVPDFDFELHIPTKAVMGQAFLVTKINFFKSLAYATRENNAPRLLHDSLLDEVAQSIYSKMAEELFISIVTDARAVRAVRERAGAYLFRIWDERLQTEIDDFAPLLEAAWQARYKVKPVLGTLMGTNEVMRLFQNAYDTNFLDFFAGDDCADEAIYAFEEFVFGISYEEITRLREHMELQGKRVISESEARAALGLEDDPWPEQPDPHAVYTSYKRRKIKSMYRELTGSPGPKRTAEEYVMLSFLRNDTAAVNARTNVANAASNTNAAKPGHAHGA